MINRHHPAVEVVELCPLQDCYVAHCPNCICVSGEAVIVDRALTDFHRRWGGDLQEFADGCFVESDGPDDAEGRR